MYNELPNYTITTEYRSTEIKITNNEYAVTFIVKKISRKCIKQQFSNVVFITT